MKLQHYKSLTLDGQAMHGGDHQYDLPVERHDGTWMPGAWTPVRNVNPCESGWHTWTERDALSWLGPAIYRAEVRGAVDADDKYVSRQIRLTSRTCWDDSVARLYTVSCALDVLPLYESRYPGDTRVSDCLLVTWEYALGMASAEDLAAARDAASSAAWTAFSACDAASSAAWSSAWAAASSSASSSAWATTWASAGAGTQRQCARLIRYLDGDIPLFPEWPK